jgi:hypothetical protein
MYEQFDAAIVFEKVSRKSVPLPMLFAPRSKPIKTKLIELRENESTSNNQTKKHCVHSVPRTLQDEMTVFVMTQMTAYLRVVRMQPP